MPGGFSIYEHFPGVPWKAALFVSGLMDESGIFRKKSKNMPDRYKK